MPGFNLSGNTGLATLGRGNSPTNRQETLRQHRWLVKRLGPIQVENKVLIAQSFTLPNVDIDIQEIQGALIKYKFAKSVSWDNAQVVFYDTFGALEKLNSWRDLVYTNFGGIGSHKNYKKETIIELLDGAGKRQLRFCLQNSWPKKISHGPLSYVSSEIKLITLDLVYDFAEVTTKQGA